MNRRALIAALAEEELQIGVPAIVADHLWEAPDKTITNGLVSELTDTGAIGGANMTQPTDANRPQDEYDKTGEFEAVAGNLVLSGTDVDSWGNSATATTRSLPAMTGSGATRPTWNSVENSVDFATGDVMSVTGADLTVTQFSVRRYFKSLAGISFSALTYQDSYVRYGLSTGQYIWMGMQAGQNSNTVIVFATIVAPGGSSVTKTYTYAQINSLLLSGLELIAVYRSGILELYENGALVGTNGQPSSLVIAQRTAVTNTFTGATISEKAINVFATALTALEVANLYANRDNFSYELPKFRITSTAASKMIATINYGTLTKLSFFACVRLPLNVYLPASDTFYPLMSHGNVSARVEMRVRTNATQAFFRFYLDIGGTTYGASVDVLSIADFKTKYAGKTVFLNGVYDVPSNSITLMSYLNGSITPAVTNTIPASYTNVNHVLSILGRDDEARYAPVGTRMYVSGIFRGRALSATEFYRLCKYYESIEPTLINS